jgi:hypothetical protein
VQWCAVMCPLQPVRSRWLAPASYSSPNLLATGYLQVSAR